MKELYLDYCVRGVQGIHCEILDTPSHSWIGIILKEQQVHIL